MRAGLLRSPSPKKITKEGPSTKKLAVLWSTHLRDGLHGVLHVEHQLARHAVLGVREQRDGGAVCGPRAARTPDAVHVRVDVARHVQIDHRLDGRDVQPGLGLGRAWGGLGLR